LDPLAPEHRLYTHWLRRVSRTGDSRWLALTRSRPTSRRQARDCEGTGLKRHIDDAALTRRGAAALSERAASPASPRHAHLRHSSRSSLASRGRACWRDRRGARARPIRVLRASNKPVPSVTSSRVYDTPLCLSTVDTKEISATRRERIEATVLAGGRHVTAPHEAWIASDPFRNGVRVLITGSHGD
jgi:hypothetical protein